MQEGGCGKLTQTERQPTVVSETKQVGEVRARPTRRTTPVRRTTMAGGTAGEWAWTEPCVWTERMLTALEEGVKGGKWFSLMDKMSALRTLRRAFEDVKRNGGSAGVDHQTVEMFSKRLEENLEGLYRALNAGTYQPKAIRRVWIPKPGRKEKRPLGIPTVRDRVVQTAMRYALEPIFERDFATHSYGFRPGRGCKDALRRVNKLLKAGYTYVVDADLKSYFDTIPHDRLMSRIEEKVSDGAVLSLLRAYLEQDVMETMKTWRPEQGTPQGAVISPLLSNIYLDALDRRLADSPSEMIRYADDFVILCRSRKEAEEALAQVRAWTQAEGLVLHPEKTRIVDMTQPAEAGGFDFLGYHFERGWKWPRKTSLRKLKDTMQKHTRRTSGQSMERIVSKLNPVLRGWYQYFQHSHKFTFSRLDQWIRMRLRSILRKRSGRQGRGRGLDHHRWPNAYFAALGLFSLATAHAQACQSPHRAG